MSIRAFIKGQAVDVTASIVLLKTLLTDAAFNTATNVLTLQNIDGVNTLYWAIGDEAPVAKTNMAQISSGSVWPLHLKTTDLDKLYVCADAAQKAYVIEEYEPSDAQST